LFDPDRGVQRLGQPIGITEVPNKVQEILKRWVVGAISFGASAPSFMHAAGLMDEWDFEMCAVRCEM
jgi:hypothetical protein